MHIRLFNHVDYCSDNTNFMDKIRKLVLTIKCSCKFSKLKF